jgi:abequosyltransferase
MKKLLTISIPTFNRAKELDNQLAWLVKEIRGFEDDCEIIISDNCSNDDTQDVINKWQKAFNNTTFKSNRNSENIGWMKNFVYCVNAATSHYTWIVGDDDLIYEGTLAYVLEKLKKNPDLSLLYLNFLGRDKETGEVMGEHWFDTDLEEKDISAGKAIFQQCLEKNIGSVIFISATVFRTDLARIALQKWPASVENWGGLAYWNGYCAAHGSVLVTQENYLECAIGVSYWQKDPKAWFGIRHRDIPEVYLKLQEIGYSPNFCRRNILHILKEDLKGSELIPNLKYFVWCFKNSPFWSMKVTSFFMATIGSVTFAMTAPEQISETVVINSRLNSSYQEIEKV